MSDDFMLLVEEMAKFGSEITTACVVHSFLKKHKPELVLDMTGRGLLRLSDQNIFRFDEFKARKTGIIRSLGNEELAEFIADCIMENSNSDKINIPSPFGGYWNMDLTSKEDIKKALLEEIELRGITNE